jgi:hypothetical protein
VTLRKLNHRSLNLLSPQKRLSDLGSVIPPQELVEFCCISRTAQQQGGDQLRLARTIEAGLVDSFANI